MLRSLKLQSLRVLRNCRTFQFVADSGWRRERLLILCYHGVSLRDEHLWNPWLYITSQNFSARLEQIRAGGYRVLPLGEAVHRLYANDLPPRSVAITFDDGLHDFHAQAWPVLQRYGFPATVYLTSYYSDYNRPVFRLICDYMLWQKGRLPEARSQELNEIDSHAKRNNLSGAEKNQFAAELAKRIGADWEDVLDRRLLHIMTPAEVREISGAGVDVQLHTHRHLTPKVKDLFLRELDDNAARIQASTNTQPRHFCYPSGVHYEKYPQWLREWGAESAVTCEMGIAAAHSDTMLLPRVCDHSNLTPVEFEAWLCGLLARMPQRNYHAVDPD